MITLGMRMKHLLSANRISQKKLAEKISIPTTTLSGIVNDKKEPGSTKLFAIAQYFNVSMEWLLTGDLEEENKQRERRSDYSESCLAEIIRITKILPTIERQKVCQVICTMYDIKDCNVDCDKDSSKT